MKIRDFLKRFRRRPPHVGENERSSDSVDKAFTDSYEKAQSVWAPSQQDRPRH